MRLRHFVILWLLVTIALFALIPESRVVARFAWDSYIAGPDYVESEGEVALTSTALIVSPIAYLPYMWIAAGLAGLAVHVVRRPRTDSA